MLTLLNIWTMKKTPNLIDKTALYNPNFTYQSFILFVGIFFTLFLVHVSQFNSILAHCSLCWVPFSSLLSAQQHSVCLLSMWQSAEMSARKRAAALHWFPLSDPLHTSRRIEEVNEERGVWLTSKKQSRKTRQAGFCGMLQMAMCR